MYRIKRAHTFTTAKASSASIPRAPTDPHRNAPAPHESCPPPQPARRHRWSLWPRLRLLLAGIVHGAVPVGILPCLPAPRTSPSPAPWLVVVPRTIGGVVSMGVDVHRCRTGFARGVLLVAAARARTRFCAAPEADGRRDERERRHALGEGMIGRIMPGRFVVVVVV